MPHNGITYRGKHSDEFGTIVKTVGRPIIAPVKQVDEEVAYRDGNVDYSEAGGRLYYEDKVLELEFTVRAMNTTELHKKVSRMINWLSGVTTSLYSTICPRSRGSQSQSILRVYPYCCIRTDARRYSSAVGLLTDSYTIRRVSRSELRSGSGRRYR